MLSSLFLFNEKDKIMYEATLNLGSIVPVVFSICKRREAKTTKKTYEELDMFTEPVEFNIISKQYVLLTESEEFMEKIFTNSQFKNLYTQIEKYIDMIFYTDRRGGNAKNAYIASFDISNAKSSEYETVMKNINLFVHCLLDYR